ncbi:MAG: FadR/GntR family transcriptional regulator [Alphaproteobacteria bacterium]
MTFGPIKPKKVVDVVFERLRERIDDGTLVPGDRLPSERALAKQMQVSRPVVREALNLLVGQGLLEIRPRQGVFVRIAGTAALGSPLVNLIGDSLERATELLEVRRELETYTVSLAAEFATSRDIEDLAAIIAELERVHRERKTGEEVDARFHCRIAQAAGSTVLTHLMATLHDALAKAALVVASRLNASRHYRDTIFSQHCAIFEAIREHAPERARQRMREHLDFVIRELRYYTRKNADSARSEVVAHSPTARRRRASKTM